MTSFHAYFRSHGFELKMTARLSRHNTDELMLDPHSDGDVSECDQSQSDVSDPDLYDEEEQ